MSDEPAPEDAPEESAPEEPAPEGPSPEEQALRDDPSFSVETHSTVGTDPDDPNTYPTEDSVIGGGPLVRKKGP